ncbi:MAG: CitMHS family transporter [Rhodospirillaceae bacterium]|nr:CitMHS family transporter [Rhodospirillaceae bacterium]
MLTILGFGMVMTFMTLIIMKRLSPLVALTVIPILFALLGGFGGEDIGQMMLEGIRTLAPTGVMLMFAILYFGLMIDAGLFDPVVDRIVKIVGDDPLKVVVGSAVLALVVSIDGDGSTTYMIVVASMLPLYKRLRMDPLKLTCVAILASGVMNITPWGGPLARAASALQVDPGDVFRPLILPMVCAAIAVLALSYWLGLTERRRLASAPVTFAPEIKDTALLPLPNAEPGLKRPKLLWFNLALTIALMTGLILAVLPLSVLFMVGFAFAAVVNYPKLQDQRQRIAAHAANALAVVAVIFAAGIFTGILQGTGMVAAMSESLIAVIPPESGPYLAVITAVVSLPFTFFMSNDAFYFGVLPILAESAAQYGISPVEMARASMIAPPFHLLSPLVPSTYLLVGLAGVEFGDHQRFTLKWAVMICAVLLVASLALGLFPFAAG